MKKSKNEYIKKRMRGDHVREWSLSMCERFGNFLGCWSGSGNGVSFGTVTVSTPGALPGVPFTPIVTTSSPGTVTAVTFTNTTTGVSYNVPVVLPYTGTNPPLGHITVPGGSYTVTVTGADGTITTSQTQVFVSWGIQNFTPSTAITGVLFNLSINLTNSASIASAYFLNSVTSAYVTINGSFPQNNVSSLSFNNLTLSGGSYYIVLTDTNGIVVESGSTINVSFFQISSASPTAITTGNAITPTATLSVNDANVSLTSGDSYYSLVSNPTTKVPLTITSSNPQSSVVTFTSLPIGLNAGSWTMYLKDSLGDVISSGSPLVSTIYTPVSTTPTFSVANSAMSTSVVLSTLGTVSNLYYQDTYGSKFYITGTYPYTGVTINVAFSGGLNTGRYKLYTIDPFNNINMCPSVVNVTFTLVSFYPSSININTTFTGVLTLGQANQSISTVQLVSQQNSSYNYYLIISTSQPMGSTVCNFQPTSIPQSGIYNLIATDYFTNQTTLASAIIVNTGTSITSTSTNPSTVNTNVSFSPSITLSVPDTITNAVVKNISSLVTTTLTTTPSVNILLINSCHKLALRLPLTPCRGCRAETM
jgi:hypothetical protein